MTDPKILIPVIRQMLPAILASDIVGVQPMQGPIGSIFTVGRTEPITWEEYLQFLSKRYTSWTKLGQPEKTGDGVEDANYMMKKKFPGPYTVVEKYDVYHMVFSLALEFESPQEELMWKIKWSS